MYVQRTKAYADSFHKVNNLSDCIVSPEHFPLEDYYYNEPVLNPNNAFEFAFIRDEGNSNQTGWNAELCVYNFCSNETKVLTDLVGYGIDWSVKDWIIFTGKDLQLYRIKSNGDSLFQLTNTGTWNDYARWSPDGSRYIYRDASESGSYPMKISNLNGVILESIDFYMASSVWLNEKEIIYSKQGNTELRKFNLETENSSIIALEPGIAPSGDRMTIDENENIYTTSDAGTLRITQTGNIELLDTSYNTYSSGYIQKLTENKVLLQRFITDTTYYPCTVYGATYISILDLNDNSEKYVDIPQ
jgi:Tol biopolymer transport system component